MDRWSPGDAVVRREVLGLDPLGARGEPGPSWQGRAWLEMPVRVVADEPAGLVTYIEPGAPFTFPPGEWPIPDGRHPWSDRRGWEGHGCLMFQRPLEHHAVWHFWEGADRRFACWYVNLQTAFTRFPGGYDTQDLEVDIVVAPDGSWTLKDWELLATRVDEGRFTAEAAERIRLLAMHLTKRLDSGEHWWDDWSDWTPPADWSRYAGA